MKNKMGLIAALAIVGLLVAAVLGAQKFGLFDQHKKESSTSSAAAPGTGLGAEDTTAPPEIDPATGEPILREHITTSPAPAPDPEHEKYVEETTDRLSRLGMMNDEASREAIMAEFKNPDRRIRQEALEAIIQFGDRSVIPRLEEIAAQTTDPIEQKEIIDAIEYIKLPSLTEYLAEQERLKKQQGKQ